MRATNPQSQNRRKAEPRKNARIVSRLLEWFSRNARPLPWRRQRDPYGIWVSEIMLQQTQARTVIPYWERWMRALPTVQALAAAPPEEVLGLWEGLGYYRRARHLHEAAKRLASERGGELPKSVVELLELPGIGRYTAGAIASIAFQQPAPIVDGNVSRVLARLFGLMPTSQTQARREKLWEIAGVLAQEAADVHHNPSGLNQALMELGALVCSPRDPACGHCPVQRECAAFNGRQLSHFVKPLPRLRMISRRVIAFVANQGGLWCVRQRPTHGINASLWEFPNLEVGQKADPQLGARQIFGQDPAWVRPFLTVRHSITCSRITLEVYRVGFAGTFVGAAEQVCLPLAQLARRPFSSAHRKIINQLQQSPASF